mgnify:CR=1 FL=1
MRRALFPLLVEAYRRWREAGWSGIGAPAAWGGHAMPVVVQIAGVSELKTMGRPDGGAVGLPLVAARSRGASPTCAVVGAGPSASA